VKFVERIVEQEWTQKT